MRLWQLSQILSLLVRRNIWITTWNFLTFFSQVYIVTSVQAVGYDWPTVDTLDNYCWLIWALKEHTSGASRMTQWTIIVWIYPNASGGVLKKASQDRIAQAGALCDIGIFKVSLVSKQRIVHLCTFIFRLRFTTLWWYALNNCQIYLSCFTLANLFHVKG